MSCSFFAGIDWKGEKNSVPAGDVLLFPGLCCSLFGFPLRRKSFPAGADPAFRGAAQCGKRTVCAGDDSNVSFSFASPVFSVVH